MKRIEFVLWQLHSLSVVFVVRKSFKIRISIVALFAQGFWKFKLKTIFLSKKSIIVTDRRLCHSNVNFESLRIEKKIASNKNNIFQLINRWIAWVRSKTDLVLVDVRWFAECSERKVWSENINCLFDSCRICHFPSIVTCECVLWLQIQRLTQTKRWGNALFIWRF